MVIPLAFASGVIMTALVVRRKPSSGVIGIAGTLLLGWGITTSVILSQANIPVGIYNARQPLLAERKGRRSC